MGELGNLNRPKACWEIDRTNCLTSGDYVVAASVEELPVGNQLYQVAFLSSNYSVYYWDGISWVSSGVTIQTHSGPVYKREPNAHAFLLRRIFDNRSNTELIWHGSALDTLEAGEKYGNGTYAWGRLPVHSINCINGLCTAKVPQPLGDAYWRVNGGVALRMTAN